MDEEIGSFVLPVGATINMDGTALYQTVAVIFMAQFHMIDLTLAQQATIIFTATLASIGAASVPSAGMIMLIPILESVGLNPAWIAIIRTSAGEAPAWPPGPQAADPKEGDARE